MNKKDEDYNLLKGTRTTNIITIIIIVLIIVVVTIKIAKYNELMEYTQKAAEETKDEIEDEQELSNGSVNIDGKHYNSIDDYMINY